MPTPVQLSDLARRIEERLGRYGMDGRVEISSSTVRLEGHGRRVELVFHDIAVWGEASPDEQARTVDRVVREIVRVRRGGAVRQSPNAWLEGLRPLLFVLVVGAAGVLAWRYLGAPAIRATSASMAAAATSGAKLAAPAAVRPQLDVTSACQRVSARIATGGSVTVIDRDGWVVELMLLSPEPAFSPDMPQLDAFFAKSNGDAAVRRLIWEEDPELSALHSNESFVFVTTEPMGEVVSGMRAGLRIGFSGQYVAKYFDETTRVRMQRLAAALYEGTGATLGAMYARCATGSQYQIGSWFRGKDLPRAALALLGTMGTHAEIVHVEGADPRTNSAIEQRRVWDALTARSAKLDRSGLTLLLAEDGGMLAAKPGSWATISFPFADANRATRVSLRLARKLGVAPRN